MGSILSLASRVSRGGPTVRNNTQMDLRQIGILGSGCLGRAFATHLVKHDYEVLISNSRGPSSLSPLMSDLGKNAKAVTVQEAAQAQIVVLAIPWIRAESVLRQFKDWGNRILVDAMNHFTGPAMGLANLNGRVSSEIIAELAPGARVVKALNTLHARHLENAVLAGNARRVIFLSGDDAEAKAIVSIIVSEIGFAPVNLGSLRDGGRLQQIGGALAGPDFVVMSH